MLASAAVFLLGVVLCLGGFVMPTLVDIGAVVILIGLVGLGVRGFEIVRWIVKD